MNLSQLTLDSNNRRTEDNKHVQFTIKLLKSENSDQPRLQKIIQNEKNYQQHCKRQHPTSNCGFRASNIVIQACEYLLTNLPIQS